MTDDHMKAVLAVLPQLDNPPTDRVTATGLLIRQALAPYSDDMAVDIGMGFDEVCLDLYMDGRPIRVIAREGQAHDQ